MDNLEEMDKFLETYSPPKQNEEETCDFSGGTVVKNLPASAGDMGLSPGPGRSHMLWSNKARAPQLLSLHSRAREPQLLSLRATTTEAHMLKSPCSIKREATAMRSPRTTARESPHAVRKTKHK